MYRLLLVLALLIVLFILVKRVVRELRARHAAPSLTSDPDQMVQDPNCRTFVPRRAAVVERIGGQSYCFCSRACATAFEKQLSR